MKKINSLKDRMLAMSFILIVLIAFVSISSCDPSIDALKFELPEANSIEDLTPPQADFIAVQQAGTEDAWKDYFFSNGSFNATTYLWDFGNGNTSTDFEPEFTFPGEGMFDVSLTASDDLGVSNTYTETIEVIEPEQPAVPNPVLINSDFDRLPKSTGSDCCCSAWINRAIGDQGESSSGNGGSNNVFKWDNNEPDILYQEFEVVPNAEYTITIVTSFKSLVSGGTMPSMLELRVLAGSGYTSGYIPTYYSETVDFPQGNSSTGFFGYTSIAQVEDAANNLLVETQSNPNDEGYMTYAYTFNAGANDSVALYARGIGGPATGGGGGDFGFNSGDEEIRADSITITAN